jgi:hypothetical protein
MTEDHQAALVALELAKGKLLPPEGSTVRMTNAEGKQQCGTLQVARRLAPHSPFVRVVLDVQGVSVERIVSTTTASSLQLVKLPSPCPPIAEWLHLGGR